MVKPASFDSKGMKKGAWSEDEDNKLKAYVMRYGHWNWRLLPKYAGLKRCGKSCRLRWVNYLKPGVKKGNFTKEEEDLIVKLQRELGNKWSAIALKFPGRTDSEIKNYWYRRIDKRCNKRKTKAMSKANTNHIQEKTGEITQSNSSTQIQPFIYPNKSIEIHQDSAQSTEVHQHSAQSTEIHQNSAQSTEVHQDSAQSTEIHQNSAQYTEIHQDSAQSTEINTSSCSLVEEPQLDFWADPSLFPEDFTDHTYQTDEYFPPLPEEELFYQTLSETFVNNCQSEDIYFSPLFEYFDYEAYSGCDRYVGYRENIWGYDECNLI